MAKKQSISVTCEECGRVLKVPAARAGKRGRCPDCKAIITVPAAAEAPGASGKKSARKKAEKPSKPKAEKAKRKKKKRPPTPEPVVDEDEYDEDQYEDDDELYVDADGKTYDYVDDDDDDDEYEDGDERSVRRDALAVQHHHAGWGTYFFRMIVVLLVLGGLGAGVYFGGMHLQDTGGDPAEVVKTYTKALIAGDLEAAKICVIPRDRKLVTEPIVGQFVGAIWKVGGSRTQAKEATVKTKAKLADGRLVDDPVFVLVRGKDGNWLIDQSKSDDATAGNLR